MKNWLIKYDYSKCDLEQKKLLDNQICLMQCVWNEKGIKGINYCLVTKTKCKAKID